MTFAAAENKRSLSMLVQGADSKASSGNWDLCLVSFMSSYFCKSFRQEVASWECLKWPTIFLQTETQSMMLFWLSTASFTASCKVCAIEPNLQAHSPQPPWSYCVHYPWAQLALYLLLYSTDRKWLQKLGISLSLYAIRSTPVHAEELCAC